MAKIKKYSKDPVGVKRFKQVNYTIRLPEEWMAYLQEILETRQDECGHCTMSDLMRETIYENHIRPFKDALAETQ